ncbi:MAG: hypothetical protein JWP47_2559 [Polaromonas sp.]|nr:hypothetical protein [Polaromonas sp.]
MSVNDDPSPENSGDDRHRPGLARRKRKFECFRPLALFLSGVIAIFLIATAVAWWWTGTDGSLAAAVRLAQKHLISPPQQLSTDGVTGSLRAGGHIDRLQWRKEGLKVDATDVSLAWQPLSILTGTLKLDRVAVARLAVDDQRPPTPPAAGPPDNIRLPVALTLDELSLGSLRLTQRANPDPMEISDVKGSYGYDKRVHRLVLANLQGFGGRYSGKAALTDSSPLQLDGAVSGGLVLSVPGGNSTTVPVTFQATATGALTELSINASAQTSAPLAATATNALPAGTPTASPAIPVTTQPQVSLTATVTPWAAQPVPRAEAVFNQLNVGALWPQAPQTLLNGTASVRPLAPAVPGAGGKPAHDSWSVQLQLTNSMAGPIDKQRLPLDELRASAQWQGGVVAVESMRALTAGGELSATGTWAPPAAAPSSSPAQPAHRMAPQVWKLRAILKNIDPARLHTQLASLPLAGQATASSQLDAINFDADLKASTTERPARSSPLAQLRLQSASASGTWSPQVAGGTLALSALQVRTDDGELAGTLEAQIAQPGGKANLTLTAPGLNAQLKGELREKSGGGELDLRMRNAAEAIGWIGRLPGVPADLQAQLRSSAASGSAQVAAQWQGGWQDPAVKARLSVPTLALTPPTSNIKTAAAPTTTTSTMPVTATASAGTATSTISTSNEVAATPSADIAAGAADAVPGATPTRLVFRDVQADVSGRLSQAQLSLRGRFDSDQRRLRLQLDAEGGQVQTPGPAKTLAASAWRVVVKRLDASVVEPAISTGTWGLGLRQPVPLRWTPAPTANGAAAFEAGAGEAVLSAPTAQASSATISWEPVRWSNNQLTTAGKLTGLPMAWAELFAGPQLAGSLLTGDLVFDGSWDARLTDRIDVKAGLLRRGGDITVQAENAEGRTARVAAGIREARISLVNEGDALSLALVWDSERAGSANGEIKTRLTRLPATADAGGGWTWASDAPLDGRLRAQLPRLGVWSVLAPPGWRIRGSLATNIAVSGNRDSPQLAGTLQASDLALRSVADGIEFGNGRLRATLDGTRMRIDEFSLQGAAQKGTDGRPAGSGGLLFAQGQAAWLNQKPDVRLDIRLDRLRASIRTDRQITLSGALQASLQGKQASVTGALKVDQARIVLPEEGTPQLGSDVVVRSASSSAGSAGKSGPAEASATSKAKPASAQAQGDRAVKVAVELDMGSDFRVQGKGIDTQLRGRLMLAAESLANPRLTGEIRTVGGQYRAYGQRLDVEQGFIRFTGQLDNPTLDILAIRPNLIQRVGVQIQGTALLPRVRLYAEPDLPDAEKLSWLVLGRSSASGGGDAALLQQAAVALLGSKGGTGGGLAGRFGLDELSYGDASGGAGGSAVTLGKRFSNNFYAAYERSLSGAVGTLRVFYDLSQRFTVRVEAGQSSAVDLIFTFQYD